MCARGALSACWLPGYRSNWGVSRELLLSEPEPVHTALVLSPLVFVVHSSQHFNPPPQWLLLNSGFISFSRCRIFFSLPLSCICSLALPQRAKLFIFLSCASCYHSSPAFYLPSPLALWRHFSLSFSFYFSSSAPFGSFLPRNMAANPYPVTQLVSLPQ